MRFSQDFIDKVREANRIGEIIGQYTELKNSGSRLMGRCPFPDHSDKSPSFSVREDNQLYYCFGCKKTGNIFTFLETFNGMSFPEAVEFLARRANIAMPEKEERGYSKASESRDVKDELLKVNKTAAVFFYHQLRQLPPEAPAKKYLVTRGMSEDIVEKFKIGVTFEEWEGLVHHFDSRKVPLGLAEKLGLIKPRKNGQGFFDLFRERLMFPIFSPTGDVVGFGGRTLGDALPKYVNSSESPVFSKGKILYGLHETGKYIRAKDHAIVVEGYMDAISLYAAGVQNVVAILGTAFTADHAKLLKRYTSNVTMLLDGDEAGILGAERSLPILLAGGLMPKGFIVPDEQDPDDFVRAKGAEVLLSEMARAPELYSLLLKRRWMQDYHALASDKVRVIGEAMSALQAAAQNRQLQELYIIETARELDVDVNWIRRALQDVKREPLRIAPESKINEDKDSATSESLAVEVDEVIQLKGAPRDESFVLSLLLSNETLWNELLSAGFDEVLAILSHSGLKSALQFAIARYRAKPSEFSHLLAALISKVDQPDVLTSAIEMRGANSSDDQDRRLMADYLQGIRSRFLQNQGKKLAQKLRDGASPEDLAQFMSLQRDRVSSARGNTEQ